jgi:hypothetical protein
VVKQQKEQYNATEAAVQYHQLQQVAAEMAETTKSRFSQDSQSVLLLLAQDLESQC